MAGNKNSGRRPKTNIDPTTGEPLLPGIKPTKLVEWPLMKAVEKKFLRVRLLVKLGTNFPDLRGTTRRTVINRMVDIIGWYQTEILECSRKKNRGRKSKTNIQILLSDCEVIALHTNLGKLWQTSGGAGEGAAVTLARIAAEVVGDSLPADLRRQIKESRLIS